MQNTTNKAPSLKAIALAAHDKAGFTGTKYNGLSKTRNSGNTATLNLISSKATARTAAQFTPRMLSTLTEIATKYGNGAFPLIGIDGGQAAIFINSGVFVSLSAKLAGDKADIRGVTAKLSAPILAQFSGKPKAAPAPKAEKPAKPAPVKALPKAPEAPKAAPAATTEAPSA